MCLEIVFPVKLEGVLLQYKAKHFSEKISSYRRLLGMKIFVCVETAFLRIISLLLISSLRARCSSGGRLFLGLTSGVSASFILTSSK